MTELEAIAHKLNQWSYFSDVELDKNSVNFTYGREIYTVFPPSQNDPRFRIYRLPDMELWWSSSLLNVIKKLLETT